MIWSFYFNVIKKKTFKWIKFLLFSFYISIIPILVWSSSDSPDLKLINKSV